MICLLKDCRDGKFFKLVESRFHSTGPIYLNECFPQSSVPSDVEVLATANTKTKKPRVKSADWTEEETHEVLEA